MDEWVVSQLKQGSEKAFRYIYDQYYVLLCHIAHEYVGNRFVAETIVGDVIFHLWEVHKTLDIQVSLKKYLLKSVRNRSLDYFRSKHKQTEIVLSQYYEQKEVSPLYLMDTDSPLGILLEKELEAEIIKAIQNLPPETRTVFRKSRFEKNKYVEISEELGISVVIFVYQEAQVEVVTFLRFQSGSRKGDDTVTE